MTQGRRPPKRLFQTVQGRHDAVIFLRQTDLRVGGRILIAAADHQHRAAQQLM